ncbi:flagellar motor protein MotB [uncultured Roseovarius sp.]|uniref:flagellar motor protein MotB n=1 Tax=uncultured Roseovarius sp. TaxID=293344 RepID=UPI0026385AF3|nr:flagellar motor protein MotB [uncultured Roseovarius sp.]
MDVRSNAAPVIIKRKKIIAGGGHHGGAWKVAYADFVTAMMAFFLLMWLVNATTEQQRKGIADYFSPTVPINRISGGGNGAFGGDSVFSEDVLAQNGTGASQRMSTESRQARGDMGLMTDGRSSAETTAFTAVEEMLKGVSGESMEAAKRLRHVVTRVTDEGLVIELFDLPGALLFEEGRAVASPLLQELTMILARAARLVTNDVALAGYSRARPITRVDNSVWDLSSSRAHQLRKMLETASVDGKRMRRVTGHGDRSPSVPDPMALRNNRLEMILLRSDPEH